MRTSTALFTQLCRVLLRRSSQKDAGRKHHTVSGIDQVVIHSQDLAAEVTRDLLVAVDRDVHEKLHRQEGSVRADLVLRRVVLENPPRAARVTYDRRPVIVHDRIYVRHGRDDAFVPAREAGHEMRLDEAEHNAPVGLDVLAVHVHVAAL